MKKIVLLMLLPTVLILALNVQQAGCSEPPETEWTRTYGGEDKDEAVSIAQTPDGGYVLAGWSNSLGSGGYDFWIVKTDWTGNPQWNTAFGGVDDDFASDIILTNDGGYAITGRTDSFGAGEPGEPDGWLIKTDFAGDHLWNRTIGGNKNDELKSVIQTVDGGYALAGTTYSYGAGKSDAWLVKTNSTGHVIWNQTYGGIQWDAAYCVIQTDDEGYVIAAQTYSYGAGNCDAWLIKTDSSGDVEWDVPFGGGGYDRVDSVVQTIDGKYAFGGRTASYGAGNEDVFLIVTNSTGNIEWAETYGGVGNDAAWSLVQTCEGGYALAGYTWSLGAGGRDCWLVKTEESGVVQWNRTYGGTSNEWVFGGSVVQTCDGGYALAGYTESFGAGNGDFWLVKIASETIWEYIFRDSCRDTVLKISTDDKYFQFVAPDKEFAMKFDEDMRVREWGCRTFITICYEDEEIKLSAFAVNSGWDFCVAYARDVETGQRYLLIDRPRLGGCQAFFK